MRPPLEGHDLEFDTAVLANFHRPLQLSLEDFITTNGTPEHCFIQHEPKQRWRLRAENVLPAQSSLDLLFHLFVTHRRVGGTPYISGLVTHTQQARIGTR